MKRIMIVIGAVTCLTLPLFGQKVVPYNFVHHNEPASESSLKTLTEVSSPSSSFLRLFFKGTHLGNESYLILEGTDGAKQQLRKQDLAHWNFSSAYFNGDRVKISLYSAKGETNKVMVSGMKISDSKGQNSLVKASGGKTSLSNQSTVSKSDIDYTMLPHAAAVGRFTNGSRSYGTGWIAPNGAIITSKRVAYNEIITGDLDIIEFNVPPSDAFGSVVHPGPEDQYPIQQDKWAHDNKSFGFKRKHHFDINNEDYGDWYTTWAIVEALPNSTGLRPGERQQQYFQIAANPGSFTIEAKDNIYVDIFHYGEVPTDLVYGEGYRVLKRHTTTLVSSEEYLETGDYDRDDFILYNLVESDITLSDSDTGAPITYNESNVAIGVHHDFYRWAPAVGIGFRNDALINSVHNFLDDHVTYVDQSSYVDEGTGAINKPFLNILEGVEHAQVAGTVSIAKGHYDGTVYIEKPVTLRAPVGTVVIGAGDMNARKATLPSGMEDQDEASGMYPTTVEDEEIVFSATSSPNPFASNLLISYSLPRSTRVQVMVYDKTGNRVRSLVEDIQQKGSHTVMWDGNNESGRAVTPGLYVIRVEAAYGSRAVKVVKS